MQNSKKQVKNYFSNRFGVKKEFLDKYSYIKKSNSIWCTTNQIKKQKKGYENSKIRGVRALRDTNLGKKPTTYFLQFLDKKIQKNIYKLNQEEFEKIILNRNTKQKQEFGYGYIAFRYNKKIIGCGLQDKQGIKTQIPKGRTKILKNYYNK